MKFAETPPVKGEGDPVLHGNGEMVEAFRADMLVALNFFPVEQFLAGIALFPE